MNKNCSFCLGNAKQNVILNKLVSRPFQSGGFNFAKLPQPWTFFDELPFHFESLNPSPKSRFQTDTNGVPVKNS
jgi:hypothetical protein